MEEVLEFNLSTPSRNFNELRKKKKNYRLTFSYNLSLGS